MKVHRLEREQILPVSLEKAWDFFSRPRNLEKMVPPDMGFRIESLPSEQVRQNQIIIYKVRVAPGIWIPWVSEIPAVVDQAYFVDVQVSGPFKYWHHVHRFESIDCGTKVIDEIHYSVGFWPFGEIAHRIMVKKNLARMFEHRRKTLEKVFPKGKLIPET